MEICISVLGKVAEYTVAPVWRQFSYLIHYKSNIEHLASQVERLGDKTNGVRLRVDAATRNLEIIAPEVETWLRDVSRTILEKEACFEKERVAKAGCFNGWCLNLKARHSLGRKAKKMTLVVNELLGDGSFRMVAYPAPPPEIRFPSMQHSEDFTLAVTNTAPHEGVGSSRRSNLDPVGESLLNPSPATMELYEGVQSRLLPYTKEVLRALHDDNINMIGISGINMEGEEIVTTEEFIQRVKEQDLFEGVMMTVVSPNPDLKRMQGEIAEMLGLNLESESLVERAEMLRARMSADSKRYLIILADVSKILNLEEFGIPCVDVDSKRRCKIIWMSQLPNVFSDMRTQSNFKWSWVYPSVGGSNDFESRNNSIITGVMHALTDDQINPVVLCGMGGIGKTSLVEEVGKRAKADGLFDEVTMAVFTQTADLSRIQDEIAEFLGLELTEKGLRGRADKLRRRLSGTKRVLVILDNVSTQVNLKTVGIPFHCDKMSCKVLVTSRNQDIFNDMETKKNFPIDVLTEQEAWDLFKEMAGSSIESPELYFVAHEVMSKCAGLPIAITTVGRALKHKSKNVWNDALRQLTRACPENIPGMIQEVYPKIELSYECLESHEAKACFLLCCLYPEGCNIPIEDLVRYGCGLKLFKSIHSMVEGRNSVETMVGILKSSFLLVDSNREGCVRMHDVVRDAALSIASKSRDVFVVRYGTELNGWPNNYVSGQYISSTLITNETPELLLLSCPDECLLKPPATILEGMENLKVLVMKNTFVLPILPSLPLLKNLQTLCLEHCNLNLDIGPVIGELRTLMTLSLRGSYIEQLPEECKNLIDLRVLDLTGCNSLKVISPGVISKFFLLEELYMWNNFGQWVVGDQTPIVLDQPCMDRVEAQLEQEQIDRLEEEFLGSREEHTRFIDWMIEEYHDEEAETYAAITDLLFLLHLTTLEIVLPPVNNLLRTCSLLFRGLVRFRISIGMMDKKWDVNPCDNYLRLHDLDAEFSLVGSEITGLLKDTNTLEVKMKNLKDPLNVLDVEGYVNLKSLTLNDCDALEYLIDMTRSPENEGLESHTLEYLEDKYGSIRRVPRRVFPVLNSLKINGARSLNEICYGQLRMGSFEELRQLVLLNLPVLTHLWMVPTEFECLPNLRQVEVSSCHSLESLFLLSVAGGLKKLEELDIRYCHHLEEIVALEEGREHGEEANYKIKFPNLIRLNLRDLPSLVGISKNIYQMNFPQLITLKLLQLPELISLCPSSLAPESSSTAVIQHLFDPKVRSFRALRLMVVDNCEKLTGVFSSNLVDNLQNLLQLEVMDCSSLKTVFDFEGLEITNKHVTATLSCLEKMELTNLPLLEYVWKPPQNILAFQNLRMLQVMQCMTLRYVFPVFIVEGLVKLESMYISDCDMMRDIVTQNEESGDGEATNKIVLPQVKTIHLDNLPSLITFFPAPCTVGCPSLRTLVLCCPKMRTFVPLFAAAGSGTAINHANLQFPTHIFNEKVDLPVLETLEIRQMYNFKGIWNSQLPPHSFCELRDLNVSNCSRLLCLVPMYMQTRLQKLEKLNVRNCNLLEEIFEFRELPANEGHAVTTSQSREAPSTSQPEGMQISKMDSPQTQGFQNLTSLYVSDCNNLRNLLSPSIARGLENLKNLSISNCLKIEEIVTAEVVETEDNGMLPQLSCLELSALPYLTSFSHGKYAFKWPLVEMIIVDECPEMTNFCLGSLRTAKEVKISISGAGENLWQELNDSREESWSAFLDP